MASSSKKRLSKPKKRFNLQKLSSDFFILMGVLLLITAIQLTKTAGFIPDYHKFIAQTQMTVLPTTQPTIKVIPYPKKIQIPGKLPSRDIIIGHYQSGEWDLVQDYALYLSSSGVLDQPGNIVIYGHGTPRVFGDLEYVSIGDIIDLTTDQSITFKYKVVSIGNVSPDDTDILRSTPDQTLTLFTCSGFLDSTRLVVVGKRTS